MEFPESFWKADVKIYDPTGASQSCSSRYFASDAGAKWFVKRLKTVAAAEGLEIPQDFYPVEKKVDMGVFAYSAPQWIWPAKNADGEPIFWNIGDTLKRFEIYDNDANAEDTNPKEWSYRFIAANLRRL